MVLLCIVLWVSFGFLIAQIIDNREMGKEVPYGEQTSLIPLKTHRTIAYAVGVVLGFPIFVWYVLYDVIYARLVPAKKTTPS